MVRRGVPRGGPLALFWALLFLEWGGPAPDVVLQDPQHGGVGWGSYPPWVLRSGTPHGRTPLNKKAIFSIALAVYRSQNRMDRVRNQI